MVGSLVSGMVNGRPENLFYWANYSALIVGISTVLVFMVIGAIDD